MGINGSISLGFFSGVIGGIILVIIMKIIKVNSDMKLPAPLLAKKWLGDEEKFPLLVLIFFTIMGIIFGIVLENGYLKVSFIDGITFSFIPWILLNFIALPLAGAGVGGINEDRRIPVESLVLMALWSVIVVLVFMALSG